MKQYIGIDLGGTGIKGAVVREDGEILARQTCPTRPQRGPAAVAEDIAAMIRTLGRGRGRSPSRCGTSQARMSHPAGK